MSLDPVSVWADAEELAIGYLAAALPPLGVRAPVSTSVPNPRPTEFVRLMSSGSERLTPVHRLTRITVECWFAGDEVAACGLAELVYAALDAWPLVPAFGGWAGGPYPQPDPDTGCPRYVMTCLVRHRSIQ